MGGISVNVTLDFSYHKLGSVIWPGQSLSITGSSLHKGKVFEILLTSEFFSQDGGEQEVPLGREISRSLTAKTA